MAKNFDWLVVGAGFTGAVVAERLASQFNQKVLLIDRRNHIGGNSFDYRNEFGNLVQLYGPHIFHTNSKKIFDYLGNFTAWRPYFHKVLGHIDGQFVPVPFNLNTISALFPPSMANRLSQVLIERLGYGAHVPIMKLREIESEGDLSFLADYIYNKVFVNYTTKQWGRGPNLLDDGVTARVPVIVSRDDRYFRDTYQAMPVGGYSAMFEKILSHPNIQVELETTFAEVAPSSWGRAVYCGSMDEFFSYSDGVLPYRSLRFDFETVQGSAVQSVGTINYPNEFDFTRITDFSHLSGESRETTTLVTEYPQAHVPGVNEPYYPIPAPETKNSLRPYLRLAAELKGKIWFAGRLADYQYYNMDQACGRALSLFEKELAPAIINKGSTF